MPTPGESPLLLIDLPPPEAALAVRRAWDRGEAVAVADPRAPRSRLLSLADALRPTHLVDGSGYRHLPGGQPVRGGVGAVVSTSGTTAEPRHVVLSREALETSARAVSEALEVVPAEDHWLACVPLHHIAGLAIVARSYFCGTALTVQPSFDVAAVGASSAHCTLVSLVPTMLSRLLEARAPLGEFRRLLLGGGPLPSSLRRLAADAGARVATTYGMSETGGGCVHDGIPLRGVQISISEESEILVKGDVVMSGYHLDLPATRIAFTSDGWLRTGDLGATDSRGRLEVIDRMKDIVITGGVNVSPSAVERVLMEHPAVLEVCVIGAPDDEWGERVVACVVPRSAADPPGLEELRSFGSERLSPAELPRELRLVAELPRSAGGKVIRRRLRRMAQSTNA